MRGRCYLACRVGRFLQATAGGSPAHPSYPAGHAVQNGAFATVLKVRHTPPFLAIVAVAIVTKVFDAGRACGEQTTRSTSNPPNKPGVSSHHRLLHPTMQAHKGSREPNTFGINWRRRPTVQRRAASPDVFSCCLLHAPDALCVPLLAPRRASSVRNLMQAAVPRPDSVPNDKKFDNLLHQIYRTYIHPSNCDRGQTSFPRELHSPPIVRASSFPAGLSVCLICLCFTLPLVYVLSFIRARHLYVCAGLGRV